MNEYVNSDATNSKKIIYLERRQENELGKLDILLSHSDICSPKYLNELATLSLSFDATSNGYNEFSEMYDLESLENLSQKTQDYYIIIREYNEMYDNIENEDYEKVLANLDVIEDLKDKVYANIDKEISEVE